MKANDLGSESSNAGNSFCGFVQSPDVNSSVQNKFLEAGSGRRLKVKISNKPDQETPQDERT